MAEARLIDPDPEFKRLIAATGGESLKNCYQCGTCTVVCPLSPDRAPFPRKEIVWAQWGLKDRLVRDPDIWLCHQCNDCATHCPRGAHPGDVLASLRQQAIEHYAVPGFLARWVSQAKFLPLLLLIPAAMILAVIGLGGGFTHIKEIEGIEWNAFFNHLHLDIFFVGFASLAALGALVGLARFWKAISAEPIVEPTEPPNFVKGLVGVIGDVLTHANFRKCEALPKQFLGHMLVFYGFLGLFVTTNIAFLLFILGVESPFPFFHPVKILGNVSGIAFLAGWVLVIANRASTRKEAPGGSYADWLFLVVIGATVLSGFMAYGVRLTGLAGPAYTIYYLHLVLVFFLLVYLPYSKFAHLLYRTVAMIHARSTGREAETAPTEQTAAETPRAA